MCLWKKYSMLNEFLDYNLENRGNLPYIHEKINGEWVAHTEGDMTRTVRRFARYIEKIGLKNSHIALFGRNSFNWSALYFTAIAYSGIAFPIDRQYKSGDLKNILLSADIDLFFYDSDKQEIIDEIKSDFRNITFITFEDLAEKSKNLSEEYLECDKKAEDTALILFTSGTSSVPKAVMHSQKSLFVNLPPLQNRFPMVECDRLLLDIPISHVYAGVTGLLYSAVSGMQLFYGTPAIEICAKEFQEVKPTVFTSVPLLAQGFIMASEKMGISLKQFTGGKIKYFFSGGAIVSKELKEAYLSSDVHFIDAYGISEASCVVAMDFMDKQKFGSTGVAFENLDIKIENPDNDGVGEIIIKGENIMQGYYKNPKLTAEVMTDDGYYRTGDIGYIDEDGFIFITGRKRRVIITSNGKNVFADEMEEYFQNEVITKAKVFSKDEKIVMKCWYKGDENSARKIIDTKNEELPKFKKISSYELIPDVAGGRIK